MPAIIVYALVSVIIVSLISFIGVFSFLFKKPGRNEVLLLLVSLSAGTLFGSAFLHLLPEAAEKEGFTISISLLVLSGVLTFFVLEKFIHWRHCHIQSSAEAQKHILHHPPQIAPLNLLGDALHNFVDGLAIAGSYLISIPTGIATTIAVIVHEVPQEIADFGVLLYAGLSRRKALLFNFLSAAVAIVGAAVGIALSTRSELFISFILPFTAGGFVYIAGSNLIPELHKECGLKDSLWHLVALLAGIGLMVLLLMVSP